MVLEIPQGAQLVGQASAFPEIPKRPGKPLASWQLFEVRIGIESGVQKELGVRTPKGKYYPFTEGEEMVFVREGTDRKPYVRLKDNSQVTFASWQKVRLEKFKKMFERVHPHFAQLYTHLLTDYPEADELGIKIRSRSDDDVEFSGSPGWFSIGESNPYIVLHQNPQIHVLEIGETAQDEIAKKLGLNRKELANNPRLLQTFVFLHEFGHGYDYITNFLNNPRIKSDTSYDPEKSWLDRAAEELNTLITPGVPPSKWAVRGGLEKYFETYRLYYEAKGVKSPDELFQYIQVQYRNLPKEKFADDFALEVLRKYWNSLGFDTIDPTPKQSLQNV